MSLAVLVGLYTETTLSKLYLIIFSFYSSFVHTSLFPNFPRLLPDIIRPNLESAFQKRTFNCQIIRISRLPTALSFDQRNLLKNSFRIDYCRKSSLKLVERASFSQFQYHSNYRLNSKHLSSLQSL
jgi:hypothetical protein